MTRKPLSTRIENHLQKENKKLAIDLEKPLNDLLEEAIQDLLKKYEKNLVNILKDKKCLNLFL